MKKKILLVLLSLFIAGCSSQGNTNNSENSSVKEETVSSDATSDDQSNENESKTAEKKSENEETASESAKEEENPFTEANFGETIELDFAEIQIDSINTEFELNPSDTSGYYSYYEGTDGKQYVYLDGWIKNVWNVIITPSNSVARMVFDDKYTYDAEVLIEIDGTRLLDIYGIDPFDSTRIVITAQVPDELLDQYSTVVVQWGFAENFGSADGDSYYRINGWNDAKYKYQFTSSK